jgi:hypothetical protein
MCAPLLNPVGNQAFVLITVPLDRQQKRFGQAGLQQITLTDLLSVIASCAVCTRRSTHSIAGKDNRPALFNIM